MNKIPILLLILALSSCKVQTDFNTTIEFTSDLERFENLSGLKEVLKDVEIIALGEDTHGLGEVFKTKTDLVKFLHQELGFEIVAIESGYGDAELAGYQIDSITAKELMFFSTSYNYYHSKEMLPLYEYIKSKTNDTNSLILKGFDCQPQQNYFKKRILEIITPIDSTFAKKTLNNLNDFNYLYQLEQDIDTIGFNEQGEKFNSFLTEYRTWQNTNKKEIISLKIASENELHSILETMETFNDSYKDITIGDLYKWPNSVEKRDHNMYQIVEKIKAQNPNKKIILWGQNKHIEAHNSDGSVKWMGNYLKEKYDDKFYSLGCVVYKGKDLIHWNKKINEFEHNTDDFLAYHLNKYGKNKFIFNLRNQNTIDFLNKELLMMSVGGNTGISVPKTDYDGILFIQQSNIPNLIERE